MNARMIKIQRPSNALGVAVLSSLAVLHETARHDGIFVETLTLTHALLNTFGSWRKSETECTHVFRGVCLVTLFYIVL